MQSKNKVLNVARPYIILPLRGQTNNNIFQSSICREGGVGHQSERYVAGEKELMAFRNNLKRKKRLTSGVKNKQNKGKSHEKKLLMTSQEVMESLPNKNVEENGVQKALKSPRKLYFRLKLGQQKNKQGNQHSNLLKSVEKYRVLMEERQMSCLWAYSPNKSSHKWSSTLRGEQKEQTNRKLLVDNKMIVCGASKQRNQKEWLLSKQKEGFEFPFVSEKITGKKQRNKRLDLA